MMRILSNALDSPTGDVRFVCLEHAPARMEASPGSEDKIKQADDFESGADDGGAETKSRIMSRKRVIYAHSFALIARSEYFGHLLNGEFAEATKRGADGRYTILVQDASFEIIYWLLR
jgi:hypothetical protein